jgi:peptide-methionine (R)-S-oxide reductase
MANFSLGFPFVVLLLSLLCDSSFAFHGDLCHPLQAKIPIHVLNLKCQPRHRAALLLAYRSSSIDKDDHVSDRNRRHLGKKSASVIIGVASLLLGTFSSRPVWAASKSRTDGYSVQKTPQEWKSQLSSLQYEILRNGGTEKPYFSILESEKRLGIFECAGCGTPLFDSRDKFNSGTGWPSFARGLPGVEVEQVNVLMANLAGAELRCATCGGHLGDVFADGFLFVGTEAAKTGKRFCVDGAALVFRPSENINDTDASISIIRGDQPAPAKGPPSWMEPPKINPAN